MYIFEFNHTLSQQDLADIWQGLPPEIGTSFDVAEDSVLIRSLRTSYSVQVKVMIDQESAMI